MSGSGGGSGSGDRRHALRRWVQRAACPEVVVRESRRVLRPGGVLLVESPDPTTLRVGAGGASSVFSGPIGLGGANNKNITLVKIGGG